MFSKNSYSKIFLIKIYYKHCVKRVQSEVISGPYFSVFGLNTGKYGLSGLTPYLDTFHAVKAGNFEMGQLDDSCNSISVKQVSHIKRSFFKDMLC